MSKNKIAEDAVALLKALIEVQSFSREEELAAKVVRSFWTKLDIPMETKGHNTWIRNKYWQEDKPVILLNSHIDTVKPNKGYTRDPFSADVVDGKLYGLGSNDAGGCLVSLMATFRYFYDRKDLPFNLIMAATAEEEVSGINGVESILDELGNVDLVIVGEPTLMQMAIAEKGLLVIDATAHGEAGHAARDEGVNALYKAMEDIQKLKNFSFSKESGVLGKTKATVTQVEAGYQHNVVPDKCHFVIDVRTNEHYSNRQAFEVIDELLESECKERSFRLNSSGIPLEHSLVKKGIELGLSYYGSPTTSDQAVIPYTSIKIGPGDSARSHTSDEYIFLNEIPEGIDIYCKLLEDLKI
ncbi:M20/M25/M40 family metallo-hydrolase [Puteibacter caeruleilacunae]|nr:M20/M25/M40 family metallo-hydrolase [Puteibacter caeruleilacunae]